MNRTIIRISLLFSTITVQSLYIFLATMKVQLIYSSEIFQFINELILIIFQNLASNCVICMHWKCIGRAIDWGSIPFKFETKKIVNYCDIIEHIWIIIVGYISTWGEICSSRTPSRSKSSTSSNSWAINTWKSTRWTTKRKSWISCNFLGYKFGMIIFLCIRFDNMRLNYLGYRGLGGWGGYGGYGGGYGGKTWMYLSKNTKSSKITVI